MSVHGVDANLITVQWGLIGVFGVVVGLLIAPADRFLQDFLASGEASDQKRAARWAASLKITSLLVFCGLVGLSAVGARDAGLGRMGGLVTASWLLLTPLLAQAGFVILLFCLVKRVPRLLTLPLQQPPDFRPSPGGRRDPTVIRFVNEASVEMQVWWLDFDGHKDNRGPLLAAGDEATQSTYQGHRFLVAAAKTDLAIGTVEAASTPGRLVIESTHLKADS
jgi:hypothetical protein